MTRHDCDSLGLTRLLQNKCAEMGTQKAVAAWLGVTPQYLSDVLLGRREPGEAIYTGLGFSRHIVYLKNATARKGEA